MLGAAVALVLRACAVVTGSVAAAAVAVNVTWWFDPGFAYPIRHGGVGIVFGTGLLGFFIMFGTLIAADRDPGDLIANTPRGLLVVLAIVIAVAGVSTVIAWTRGANWFADDPYGWHHCHWPLSKNKGSVHTCVSHARWLSVKYATGHIFVGFGAVFCMVDCLAFAALARLRKSG